MKMNKSNLFVIALLALLLVPAVAFCQEQPASRGSIEFGIRGVTGDVYGQTGYPYNSRPFVPSVDNSRLNEYRDLKNGLYLRSLDTTFDNVLNSHYFIGLQSQETFYKNQAFLATVGQYGKFKVQFRWAETPHTFSNTTRTFYTKTAPGKWAMAGTTQLAISSAAWAGCTGPAGAPTSCPSGAAATLTQDTALNGLMTSGLFNSGSFITPSISRKAGTGTFSYNFTPNLSTMVSFTRENQVGLRPMGMVQWNTPSNPSEFPEIIDYFSNTVKAQTDMGASNWGLLAKYEGSFFQNNLRDPAGYTAVDVDNPWVSADTGVQKLPDATHPLGSATSTYGAKTSRMSSYPDNRAHNFTLAGMTKLTNWMTFMGSITPGWMTQNESLQPYTTNTAFGAGLGQCNGGNAGLSGDCTSTASLPETSAHAKKQTLAMNYTLNTKLFKNFSVTTRYRHYDYNNDTPVQDFYPVLGDMSYPEGSVEKINNTQHGFNRKTVEVIGTYFIGKKNSVKAGYTYESMDRSHRDVEHSGENTFLTALEVNPRKDLMLRLSYRHANRKPDAYDDEDQTCEPVAPATTCLTSAVVGHRRFDEATRVRERADALLQYSPLDRLTFSASYGTIQDNFNQRDAVNSLTPLGYISGIGSFYNYGTLKDNSWNYSFDANFVVIRSLSLFAEYNREKYNTQTVSRQRSPSSDNNINDWTSAIRNLVDTWAAGMDFNSPKRVSASIFYSLSASKGNTRTSFVNCPTDLSVCRANARWIVDTTTGTTAAFIQPQNLSWPEAVTRLHGISGVLKFNLTKNLQPRIQYSYEQFDNKDYQTSNMLPYMYLGLTGTSPVADPYNSAGTNRSLFLGADTPSYRAHVISATVQYRF